MTQEEDDLTRLLAASILGPGEKLAADTVAGLTISTVKTHDQGYETAIGDATGEWYPVERYDDNREAAIAGHARWVAAAPSLVKVTKLGYGSSIPDTEVVLQRPPTRPLFGPWEE